MKHHNILVGAMLTILLTCFLVIPQQSLAVDLNTSDDYQVLSEFEGKRILSDFPRALAEKWQLLSIDGYSDPREKTALCLLKELTSFDVWNYYFQELPIDVSSAVVNQSIEISKLIATEDVSGILGKIEKETAKASVNYLKEYFFKNQIKVSFGAMEVKYKTDAGNVDSPFQYIIMYQPIDNERGRVVARIYSPKEIIPPLSRGSIGMAKGFLNSLNPGENIPPFIIEIKGEMKNGMYGSYFWEGDPQITTIFPQNVPDFSLKPRTWQDKYIINPIKDKLSEIFSIGEMLGFRNETVDYILKEGDTKKIEKEVASMKEGEEIKEVYKEEKKSDVKKEEVKIEDTKINDVKVVKEVKKEEKKEIKPEEIKKEEKKVEKKEEKMTFSLCPKSALNSARHEIIFNEISWMGSKSSANDEWIELKNISNKEINLKGYTISDKGEQIKIVFDDYILPSGGFALLERTDDNSVSFKTADLIYQGALSNKDEELFLFDPSCNIEDYVSADSEWPAGDNTERRTMERAVDLTWRTYSGDGLNNIWGTPKEENSPGKIKEGKVVSMDSPTPDVVSVGGSITAISYCPQDVLSTPTHQIVFNEVAWMGSESSSSDEWIELKNISQTPIDLNNWQLLDQGNQIKVVFSFSDIIAPDGLYLLERTDDNSVPNIAADKVYFNALSDSNESLRLFDSGCNLVDEVVANPDWPAGDKDNKKSMERDSDLNWHTYSLDSVDTVSGLKGTPKSSNSPKTIVEQEEEEEDPIIDDPDPKIEKADILITEVQVNGTNGQEYIELFNFGSEEIELCPDDNNCHYLSYYSSNSNWNDPSRNWRFLEGESILPNSYYIIDVFGNSNGDWRLETAEEVEGDHYYLDGQLGNSQGSLAIFSGNPKYTGEETKEEKDQILRAVSLKVDAVSWGKDNEIVVKEGQSFDGIVDGKVLGRKWYDDQYHDSDNNGEDFQSEIPSPRKHAPRPPEKVQNLSVTLSEYKNSALLSWSIPEDEDTDPEDIDYEVYYSRGGQIDEDNLLNIAQYTNIEITDKDDSQKMVLINDLYYDSEYVFAVKAKDPEANYSPISDTVPFKTEEAIHQKQSPLYDFARSNKANFSGPTNGNPGEVTVFAKGNDSNPNNDNLSGSIVIDENRTVYFYGEIDGVWGVYAYNSSGMKWVYPSQDVSNDPTLGKDGSIYITGDKKIYCLSPSGKLEWEESFDRVHTKNVIIDSSGRIYFVASEEPNNAVLFSLSERVKTSIQTFDDLTNIVFSELILDNSGSIFFSKGNTIYKIYSNGGVIEKVIDVNYQNYKGEHDKTSRIEQIYLAPNGNILVDVYQGWCCYDGTTQVDIFYAFDNDLEEIAWSKKEYGLVFGTGSEDFYMSFRRLGFWEIGGIDLMNGDVNWTKGPFFPQTSSIVSDSVGNIYLTQSTRIVGYNPLDIKDGNASNDKIFSLSRAEQYCYTPPAIGSGVMYVSKFQEILAVRY